MLLSAGQCQKSFSTWQTCKVERTTREWYERHGSEVQSALLNFSQQLNLRNLRPPERLEAPFRVYGMYCCPTNNSKEFGGTEGVSPLPLWHVLLVLGFNIIKTEFDKKCLLWKLTIHYTFKPLGLCDLLTSDLCFCLTRTALTWGRARGRMPLSSSRSSPTSP